MWLGRQKQPHCPTPCTPPPALLVGASYGYHGSATCDIARPKSPWQRSLGGLLTRPKPPAACAFFAFARSLCLRRITGRVAVSRAEILFRHALLVAVGPRRRPMARVFQPRQLPPPATWQPLFWLQRSLPPLQLSTRPWLGRATPQVQAPLQEVHVARHLTCSQRRLKPATSRAPWTRPKSSLSSPSPLAPLTFGAPSWSWSTSSCPACNAGLLLLRFTHYSVGTSTICGACSCPHRPLPPPRDVLIACTWTRPSETWTRAAK